MLFRSKQQELDELRIKREVMGTTAIEGNGAAIDELEHEGQISAENYGYKEIKEIENARECLEYIRSDGIRQWKGEISEELICKLHALNVHGVEKQDVQPGKYRTYNVKVGHNDYGEKFENIPSQMRDFVNWINGDEAKKLGNVIRAVVAHFYLVSIHPFGDGNGRTSRALEAYLLACGDENQRGFYTLANFYYRHRKEYFEALHDARFKYKGDLNEFVRFALVGYVQELENNYKQAVAFITKLAFLNYVEELLSRGNINTRGYGLVSFLLYTEQEWKVQDILQKKRVFAGIFGKVTERTIRRDIERLEKYHLVNITNGRISADTSVMNQFTK